MSDWADKPLVKTSESAGRPRRSLAQLEADGLGITVVECDTLGPTLIERRSMQTTKWRRMGGRTRADFWFEMEGTP